MQLDFKNASEWTLVRTVGVQPKRRGRAVASGALFVGPTVPQQFLLPNVTVDEVVEAVPSAAWRGVTPPAAEVSVDCAPGESAVVAVRHESGAITFHAAITREMQPARRGGGPAASTLHFHVPVPTARGARRGMVSAAVNFILLKVKDAFVDAAVDAAIRLGGVALEKLWWKHREMEEGWFQVTASTNGLRLRGARPAAKAGERSLLLLHGTFSDAAAAFAGLATAPGGFFAKARAIYGDRIYAFNHFTVSRTPEENARMLLEGLPGVEQTFDVITHSRGGLVLRTLVEQRALLTKLEARFQLGRAILVASPNQGTPLATPGRIEGTIGLVANLLEMFPENPWTSGAAFVAHGITWLAKSLVASLPGLASMDGAGATIEALQEPSQVPPGSYAALAANYSPAASIWRRLVDAGIDSFFAGANDLVVPAEGSWLIDGASALAVAPENIGCFGPGGNIRAIGESTVNHLNVMSQPETIQFLVQTLAGGPTSLPLVDPLRTLPSRRLFRGTAAQAGMAVTAPAAEMQARSTPLDSAALLPAAQAESEQRLVSQLAMTGTARDDTLQLIIMQSDELGKKQILATYGSARVMDEFETKNPEDAPPTSSAVNKGTRFQQIIGLHKRIRMCLEGTPEKKSGRVPELPNEQEMLNFGENLFETLFTGKVRRLYDVARSQQSDRPLNLIFTSTVPWLAALPWEFAFDPSRRKFLVTEEVHFIRNVLTAVPAQQTVRQRRQLRMLVVAAQPLGSVELSSREEEERIRHGFAPLTDAGLLELDVLTDATPARLHGKIQARELESWEGESRQYDVVHFIGHGEFDKQANQGKLVFQTRNGGRHDVDIRTLREILCGRGIQLVFLNACDTARDTHATLNRGIAQALVEGGIPAVVANQYPVLDDSAVGFTDHFYWSLALGASLGEAAREARIALNYSIGHESIDWAIPVLFARDPTFRLCARRGAVKASPPGAEQAETRAPRETAGPTAPTAVASPIGAAKAGETAPSVSSRAIRVGVADLARFFKELDDTLARLDEVQDRFMFEKVEIVAPLGAWEFNADSGRSYLHAERLARMLRDKPRELGVDFLVCLTNRRMRSDQYYDLYQWWSADRKLPIMIFSTAGLGLDALGPVAGRAVANQLVETLASQLLETATQSSCIHDTGSKRCPFYSNDERDVDCVVGRRQFEKRCREKLVKDLPKDLNPESVVAAFEALLAAFDDDVATVYVPSVGTG
jgi:CHAT domain-containing protein